MKSIGIWCQMNDDTSYKEEVKTEVHINLWNISKKNNKRTEPMLDIGLDIENFRKIQKLRFYIPFEFGQREVIDLSSKLKEADIARLIFNDNGCEVSSQKDYNVIKRGESGKEMLLLEIDGANSKNPLISFRNDFEEKKSFEIDFSKVTNDRRYNGYNNILGFVL